MVYGLIVVVLIAVGLGVWFAIFAKQANEVVQQLAAVRSEVAALQAERENFRANSAVLAKQLQDAAAEDQKKVGWLDHQEREIAWLRAELEKRPKVTRKTYKILTLGVKWTGKTSLTLKWANPLTDLGAIEGTKIERYERTVSQVVQKDITTEHVFEIGDWGGEHIVDAQQELIVDEIHGLLIVVDLGGKDAKRVDPARIQDQLREFQAQALKYFFGPKTVASCKAVLLAAHRRLDEVLESSRRARSRRLCELRPQHAHAVFALRREDPPEERVRHAAPAADEVRRDHDAARRRRAKGPRAPARSARAAARAARAAARAARAGTRSAHAPASTQATRQELNGRPPRTAVGREAGVRGPHVPVARHRRLVPFPSR
jgi:hypothetical protein